MKRLFPSLLTAVASGLFALAMVPGSAQADGGNEYRVIGCDGDVFPPPMGGNLNLIVVSSFSADEIGEPCEDVLTSLGSRGFRLIDAFPPTDAPGIGFGILHYLERSGEQED